MQIVYLSNRPSVLAETWEHVRHHMPWVERALVVAPPEQHGDFGDIDGVELLDECEVSGRSTSQLAALDHVRRNVTLRRATIAGDRVDEVFLLSDDDYRPIKDVPRTLFGDDQRDIGFYCHDLASWPGHSTHFDEAQHVTGQLLSYLGTPRRCYGSHMPQIIRRDLWQDAFATLDTLRDDNMVCEWALYFNLGLARHAERFGEPQVFQTMCWPPHLHEWQLRERPREYSFENFYPEFYRPGNLFAGLPTALDPDRAAKLGVEKLLRWSELGRQTGRLDFRRTPADPWTKGHRGRRATFGLLRSMRKAYDYLSIEERDSIAELQGSLDRIEARLDERDTDS